MKKNLFSVFFFLHSLYAFTQVQDTLTRKATILYNQKGNQVQYNAEVPTLNQILGAPTANYSYLWEFGDGSYSKEAAPKKVYKKKGDYKVHLSVTNNYDNGKPPKTRPKTVAINEISDINYNEITSINDTVSLKIFNNREPIPNDEIVIVLSYKNDLNYLTNGKLYLFYNDKEFKTKNFELLETRTHYGEIEMLQNGIVSAENNESYRNLANLELFPSFSNGFNSANENLEMTLAESEALFSDSKIFEFENMNSNETRNVFFSFKTTPEMLKDTSAIVKMRSVYVPDRNYKNHKKKTLEMEIVTSHDPNKMSSNATFMNYRTVRFKTINFKTRFQNNGEGPARMIRLETDTPDMFDKKTLKIVDSYPKCPICPKGQPINFSCLDTIIKEKQIHFTFKNIYIPGSEQKNVTDKDSTKGFVKYTMKFAKDFHKQKTKSKTAIIFDKNEPVITNVATTRFMPGISIGARAGYNSFPDQKNSKSYFIGATISPYKSYRFYWQSEITLDTFNTDSSFEGLVSKNPVDLNEPYQVPNGESVTMAYKKSDSNFENKNTLLDIVPISLRYNINNYIGLGFGAQFSTSISSKINTTSTDKFYEVLYDVAGRPYVGNEFKPIKKETIETTTKKSFSDIQTSFFAGMTLGFARIGPSIGARYYKSIEQNFDYWQLYAIWKF